MMKLNIKWQKKVVYETGLVNKGRQNIEYNNKTQKNNEIKKKTIIIKKSIKKYEIRLMNCY